MAGTLVGRFLASRAWRTYTRVWEARGRILAAGIAFFGVFSLFPLLVLGFAAAGVVIGGNQQLQDTIVSYATQALPGVIGREDAQGRTDALVSAEDLLSQATDTTVVGVSALAGVAVLLFTGLGWIAALREGIRGMFMMPVMALDPVRSRLYDLAVLLSLGTLVVASALVSVIIQTFAEELLQLVGLEGSAVGGFVTRAIVLVLAFALNTAVFAVLYRVLARGRAPYRTLVGGAALAAFGVAVLQVAVSLVLGRVGGGFGFLETFVPILAVFVWLNLNANVMLIGAAWVAVGPTVAPLAAPAEPAPEATGAASGVAPVMAAPLPPVLPARWTDRAVLGAGVVLGASAAGLAHVVGGAVRTAGGGVRELLRRED